MLEQLADARAWLTAESTVLGELYGLVLAKIDEQVTEACREAWEAKPVTTATGMKLRGFGPRDCQTYTQLFECATRYRFGWRRSLPSSVVRRRINLEAVKR